MKHYTLHSCSAMIIIFENCISRNHHLAYLVCFNQQHVVIWRKYHMFHRPFNLKKILYFVSCIFNSKRIHKAILETKNNEINKENQSQSMQSILSMPYELRLIDYHPQFIFGIIINVYII